MKLKVCGLNDRENILEVLKCKPDYIGFIFYDRSPRFVKDLPASFIHAINSVKKVGVFVNESEIKILDTVSQYGLDLAQLHGDESPEFCSRIKRSAPVIKAFQISDEFDFATLTEFENACDYFLFDSKSENYGGSGKMFDFQKLKDYKLSKPFFLSGGLDNSAISEIINHRSNILDPYCLDVNSKFELSPGIKDVKKLKQIHTNQKNSASPEASGAS